MILNNVNNKIYDICILGAGIAGISLAYELLKINKNQKILIIESGDFDFNTFNDSLKETLYEGLPIKETSRERRVGGNSTTWGGLISPLDEIDFENNNIKQNNWPFEYSELEKYYKSIDEVYNFPKYSFFKENDFLKSINSNIKKIKFKNFEDKFFLAKEPSPNFSKIFKNIFDKVDLLINHTVTNIILEDNNKIVKSLEVENKEKIKNNITSKQYILCTNAIENARLLLISNSQLKNGIGNEYDNVGRNFMNHPKGYYGEIKLKKPIDLSKYCGFMYKGYSGFYGLKLKDELQKELGILNSYLRLEPIYPWTDNDGVRSLVEINHKIRYILTLFKNLKKNKYVSLIDYSETGDEDYIKIRCNALCMVKNFYTIIKNGGTVSKYIYYRIKNKIPLTKHYKVRIIMELKASLKNRIILTDKKDYFNNPLPMLISEYDSLDKNTVIEIHKLFKKEFIDLEIGEFISDIEYQYNNWPIYNDASHHLGTTLMGKDIQTSVVDENCKIHNIENLYINGGSVFPTSGNANPTYTIVALSIRLASHLNKKGE